MSMRTRGTFTIGGGDLRVSAIGAEQLGRLYDAHVRSLVLYTRQICEGGAAEDAVQEAFISLARQRRAPDAVVPWLYRAARNSAISAARSVARRRRREGVVSRQESWFESADDRLDGLEASRALACLDEDSRAVIVARLWGGLSFEEVAQLHGFSLATAHRRYLDGLARLQERLNQSWPATTTRLNPA